MSNYEAWTQIIRHTRDLCAALNRRHIPAALEIIDNGEPDETLLYAIADMSDPETPFLYTGWATLPELAHAAELALNVAYRLIPYPPC